VFSVNLPFAQLARPSGLRFNAAMWGGAVFPVLKSPVSGWLAYRQDGKGTNVEVPFFVYDAGDKIRRPT
jgi:hypothetical protein